MADDWQWDATLFKGAAPYYVRGRWPYAAGYEDALASALELDGRGRLLDVGCGPGVVALRMARLFAEVVGVDPDPQMLVEARRQADARHVTNAGWVLARAEELPFGPRSFRVATFARSFHWMDRDLVAALVLGVLDEEGAFVQVTDSWEGVSTKTVLPYPVIPQEAVREVIRNYLGTDRRAGQGVRETSPDGEERVLERAGFSAAQIIRVPDREFRVQTTDDVIAYIFSASGAAPHLFGDQVHDFESAVKRLLGQASDTGLFAERLPQTELRIWRNSRERPDF